VAEQKQTEQGQAKGIARHGRLKRPSSLRGALALLAISLAVLVVSGAAVAGLALWQFSRTLADNSIDIAAGGEPAPAIGSYENGFNIMIVGADNDPAQGAAYGERATALNDVNILVHVSADHTHAVVVSIPRDLIVDQPACTDPATGAVSGASEQTPINEAMGRGGLSCVVNTVEQLTGLDIPYAALASFAGVVRMTDSVGGVPVCLNQAVNDPEAGLNLPAGTSIVSGDTALAFLRSRHGVGDGSDLARISSQQIYLASLLRTIRGDGTFTDLPRLFALATAAADNIKLSTSLANTDTMVSMALALKDVPPDRVVFVQYPGTTEDPEFPDKVVPLPQLAGDLFARIAADQPFTVAAPPGTSTPGSDPQTGPAADAATDTSANPAAPTFPPPAPPATAPTFPPVTPTATRSAGPSPATPSASIPSVPTPSAAPTADPQPLDGISGRTAADRSCAQAYSG